MQNIIFTTAACTPRKIYSLPLLQSLWAAYNHQKSLTLETLMVWR